MQSAIRVTVAVIGLSGTSFMLSSCGLFDRPAAASRPAARPAPRMAAASRAPAQPAPATGSAAVWGVRAGLNVAALSCRGRGRQPVAGAYARMLTRHRGLLAAAYRQEQGRQGTRGFDRQQTRVYNTFAHQASPARFCDTAHAVVQRANGLDSAQFALAAPRLLGQLQASLRRP